MAQPKQKPDGASDNVTPRRVNLLFQGEAGSPAERMAAIRQLRKGQILNYLLNDGPASRVDIARALGFNLRTVSLLVASLIDENIVVERPVLATNAMGRRPVPLELNASAACVLAIEVDRSVTRFALINLQGHFLVQDNRPSDFGDSPEAQSKWLVAAATEFLEKYHKNLPPLTGAGYSFDGFVFRQHAAHHHGTVTEPMRLALEKAIHVPVSSDTNSRLIAIAEQRFGAAQGIRNAITINIGDGLSLGCVLEGRVLAGNHGIAGELGHIPLGQPGVPCYCGASGCLENIVSGSGLLRMAADAGIKLEPGRDVFAQMKTLAETDKTAAGVWDKFFHQLATAISIAANLYDPEVIVISGPAARVLEPSHAKLMEHLNQVSVPFIMEKISIRYSRLGENSVLMGAGGQILNHIYSAAHVAAEALL